MIKRICVFCGSRTGVRPAYLHAARQTGSLIAQRGYELVYGGGHVGLMGAIASSAMENGGKVIGIIPKALADVEIAHEGLTELRIVNTMHERKAMMADLADAFIALPGGYGTLEELCEIITWGQLGIHRKPFGILNVEGYYDGLMHFFNFATEEGFVHPTEREVITSSDDIDALITQLENYTPVTFNKWVNDRQLKS